MKHEQIKELEYGSGRNRLMVTLVKEGDWYSAYEWSAYLVHFYPNNLSDAERLKVTHRQSKAIEGGVMSVGLKLSMFNKFLPDCNPIVEDGAVRFEVTADMYPSIKGSTVTDLMSKWKVDVPIQEKKKQNAVPKMLTRPKTMSYVMAEIMRYQLEAHTPEESHAFVRRLKDVVTDIMF